MLVAKLIAAKERSKSKLVLQVTRCNGSCLLPYKDLLMQTLGSVMCLQSQQGYEISGQVLRFVLRALSFTYPVDFRSVTEDIDQPVKDYLPIRVGRGRVWVCVCVCVCV